MSNNILGILNLYDSPSLGGLTKNRTLASTSFLGRFALMDFAMSNFTNSQIDEINVLIRDNFRSVAKHAGTLKTWVNNTKIGRQNLLINEKGIKDPKYNSDLNALRENDWILYEAEADYVVITPAHILMSIDFRDVIKFHIEHEAEVTIVYKEIEDADKTFLSSNVLTLKDGEIVNYVKNNGKKAHANVSLRTYVVSRESFFKWLRHRDYRDATSIRMLLEGIIEEHEEKVLGYKYEGYARCIDSLENFLKTSFEFFDINVADSIFKKDWPIYTCTHNTKPTQYGPKAKVRNSFVANGAIINGKVTNSIISRYVEVEPNADVRDSIILTNCIIRKGVKVEHAVVDKYAVIENDVIGQEGSPIYIPQGKKVK